MGKPRMIILIRHAQSEGNKNRDIHQSTPDHRVKLTPEGHRQALEAGRRLRELLRPDDTLHFFTSPYRRTRETTAGILESLTSDSPSPSPFPRQTIKIYEEPRLREQDFGNFQPCSVEMERMWMERADYGHFFYRIPNGESAADAYDRVSGFNESLWRLFGEDDFPSVAVLVTHGLMTRVFLMKWYHWSVEYFEDLRNIDHCEFVVMTHNSDNGKYKLQNKLRTWSDLRKERDSEKNRERETKGLGPAPATPTEQVPIRRKWGGCPDGCTHGFSVDGKKSARSKMIESMRYANNPPTRKTDDSLEQPISTTRSQPTNEKPTLSEENTSARLVTGSRDSKSELQSKQQSAMEKEDIRTGDSSSDTRISTSPRLTRPSLRDFSRHSEDHLLHPPVSSGSSEYMKLALLHLGGRDGGGSLSGANSRAPSEDGNEEYHGHHASPLGKPIVHSRQHFRSASQDLEEDGDDELSANQTKELSRPRPHHNNHHSDTRIKTHSYNRTTRHFETSSTSQQQARRTNILGDGEDVGNYSDSNSAETESHSHAHALGSDGATSEELSLEDQQREDQSIQGSVY
ncbi:Histidine phosphatase superfamily clade-1 [Penicillium taxi]|uniref:Histidine phosphatase superfamily clade-1 n=1 Tax=Penicillium taxi TaxID=168475 RepID=UPI002544F480|nr:Histidine phosphatase superfamily clade-1 [Penicillium taxi]KAJ5888118.1 Histidine phosphatase superfamily clade-1 [Penicillium taxi]